MKRTLTFGALCVAGSFAVATSALAQSSASQSTTTTQSTSMSTSSKPIQGRVVRYEAGKSIVVVGSDGREQTFPLTASVSAPSDVAVGRTVSIVTSPSTSGGAATVTRITTTSVGSDGSMRTDTETRTTNPDQSQSSSYSSTTAPAPSSSMDSSAMSGQSPDAMSAGQSTTQSTTKSTTTQSSDGTITGTVTAYEPGKSVTFVLPDQKTVVYTIDTTSVVPSDIAVGKTYSVQTVKTTSGNGMVVRKITTTTTKTTTNP